jgi:hypothetical protein
MTSIVASEPHAQAFVISGDDWSAAQISAVEGEQPGKHVLFIGGSNESAVRAVVGGRPSNFSMHVDMVDMAPTNLFTAANPWAIFVQSTRPSGPDAAIIPPTESRCEYSPGDAEGGSQLSLGSAISAASCAALVQSKEPTANGASYSASGECVARFKMTSISAAPSEWESCYILGSSEAADQWVRENLSKVNLWMTLACNDGILSELQHTWSPQLDVAATNASVNTVERAVPINLQLKGSMFELSAVRRFRKVQVYGPPNWIATLSKYVLCSKHKDEMLQEAEQKCCEIRNLNWTQTFANSVWRPSKEDLADAIESEF